jgi:site-specific DNA recombinase
METLTKCCGYVRVSTSAQVSEGESLDTQKQQIKDFVASKGWELTKIYEDEGHSGAKIEYRTDFQLMLKDAKKGLFSTIVFTKLSRFARNSREYQNLAYELSQNNVNLVSIKEGIDPTTKTGKMIAGILSLFAEWEHETIREQMSENKIARWKDTRSFIGMTPFGYKWNKATKKLEVIEEEAEIYRKVVNMYVNEGRSFVTRLNKDGIAYQRNSWVGSTISYMMKNPCYYGNYIVNQKFYVDSNSGAGTKKSKVSKPISENINFPIPAIITKSEWDKIQETSKFRKVKTKRSGEHTAKFFLRDVLVCERCGAKLSAKLGKVRKDGTSERYYYCYWSHSESRSMQDGRHKCSLPVLKAEDLEQSIWYDIVGMFAIDRKKVFKNVFNAYKQRERISEIEHSLLLLEADLLSKNKIRNRLYKLIELDSSVLDEVSKKLQENKDEILKLEGLISNAKNKIADLIALENREKEALQYFNDNKDQWKIFAKELFKLSDADKKLLVEAMIDSNIKVDYVEKGKMEVWGHFLDYKLHFNFDILKRFVDEGKIKQFDSISRNKSSYRCIRIP